MKRGVMWVVGTTFVLLLLAGCGGSTTPDTEGQTLAEAQQTLRDAGVPNENITVTGEQGDPNDLIVCDHDPDGVAPSEPVTLQVAQDCPEEDDRDKKKKKRSGGSKRR